MAPPKKAKAAEPALTAKERIRAKLKLVKGADFIRFAEEFSNNDAQCVSTGFPQLDHLLHDEKHGWPRGRKMEVFSKDASVGKSTLVAQIMGEAQRQYCAVGFDDAENTTDKAYLKARNVILDELPSDPNIIPLLFLTTGEEALALSAEEHLERIRKMGNILDLVVLDSIATLDTAANLDKELTDAPGMGGASIPINRFYKTTVSDKATLIAINQTRTNPGGFSPQGTATVQPGGRGVKFFSAIRVDLSHPKDYKVTDERDTVIGFRTKIYSVKNKISAPYRQCTLTYLNSIGFSKWWDYLEFGIAQKLIIKKPYSSWLEFEGWKVQGIQQFHELLRTDDELFGRLKGLIDGEDIAESNVEDGPEPSKQEIEEQEQELQEEAA